MKSRITRIGLFIILVVAFVSCRDEIKLFDKLDRDTEVKLYFLSSQVMGPNIDKAKTDFQKKNESFYIDNPEAIKLIKQNWVYPVAEHFDNFIADYYLTYTEDGIYRGRISIDLQSGLAISGYGPSQFDIKNLEDLQDYIKPLKYQFFEFSNIQEARVFYTAIKDKHWLLPSPNDDEYYKWLEFEGECIVQINNKQFARDKDIKKAFDKYMPKRFPDTKLHYNIFRFTPQNSTVRICSNKDLSDKFPEEFHITIPWQKYSSIIIPLVNFDEQELKEVLFTSNIRKYKIIDKIE